MAWIYKQLGYEVPSASNALFFSGKTGTWRKLPDGPNHRVITKLSDAKIGDICYNSAKQIYQSGHGSHTTMFLGTVKQLGIAKTIRKYYKNFPTNAYLMIDVGWADGTYYYNMMKRAGITGRRSMCGSDYRFFPSERARIGKYIYKRARIRAEKIVFMEDRSRRRPSP